MSVCLIEPGWWDFCPYAKMFKNKMVECVIMSKVHQSEYIKIQITFPLSQIVHQALKSLDLNQASKSDELNTCGGIKDNMLGDNMSFNVCMCGCGCESGWLLGKDFKATQ